MSDKAFKKWVGIREKWDPKRRIGGFREKTEMNVLKRSQHSQNGISREDRAEHFESPSILQYAIVTSSL
jgi:hypothetical protein